MDTKDTASLVERFYKDFAYDCHGVEIKYGRSEAKKKLVKIGPQSFSDLAKLIKSTFPDMKTSHKSDVDWDLFGFIVWLLYEIIRFHNLPECPYSSTTQFMEQDIEVWYNYCLKHQT